MTASIRVYEDAVGNKLVFDSSKATIPTFYTKKVFKLSDIEVIGSGFDRYGKVAVSGLTIEIKVANDGTNILTTLGDIVTLINGNMEANSLCVASLTDETKADTVATEVASAVTAGGANDTGTGDVDGILMHSVDVTDGEATGALVLAGFVDLDKINIEPSTNFKTKLPMIAFLRKD